MADKRRQKGFTFIEVLVVATVMAIILGIGGSMSADYFFRRQVDDTANRITSELNLIKLQAARDGVQYRTTIDYDNGDPKEISIENRRGDSNTSSNFDGANKITSAQSYQIMHDYEMDNAQYIIDFNPNGTTTAAQTMVFKPVNETAKVSKCARIAVTQFGIIRTITGNWNFETDECDAIANQQEQPTS